jgi:hypothetical protein
MPAILPNTRINCFCEPGPIRGSFVDYCTVLHPGENIHLCENNVTPPTPPYYISLSAGEQNIIVCALEKYVDSTTDQHNRKPKTDFLIAGLNPEQSSETFVVFLEMRSTLTTSNARMDKINQCKSAIQLLCRDGDNHQGFHDNPGIHGFVKQLEENFGSHKVAAAIVPALYSESRYMGIRSYRLGRKDILIVPLPDSLFKNTITWKQMLIAMGVV